jgi:hypothetical protein
MAAPVTIIGAGLGGLTLARVLHVHGIPRRSTRRNPRTMPARRAASSIHENNGQIALQAVGLTNEFRAITHQGGEATRMLDQHGTMLLDQPSASPAGRPEVLRGGLRRILIDSLPAETIRYGNKLRRLGARRRSARTERRRRDDRDHRTPRRRRRRFDVHPAARARMLGAGAVGLPGLPVGKRACDRRVAKAARIGWDGTCALVNTAVHRLGTIREPGVGSTSYCRLSTARAMPGSCQDAAAAADSGDDAGCSAASSWPRGRMPCRDGAS